MDGVARWAPKDQADLFQLATTRHGLHPAIHQKDFWVCWTLKRLFMLSDSRTIAPLTFKGGTSLSKVYGLIRRFSEDIDLSIDRAALGYTGDRDPEAAQSRKAKDNLLGALARDVTQHIGTVLKPALEGAIKAELGASGWRLSLQEDPHKLLFEYPAPDEGPSLGYVRPAVLLELGARGDPWPVARHRITPYAAVACPDQFKDAGCEVTTLAIERTFWEKATILHAEHHRPAGRALGHRHSRHYYDLARLADSEFAEAALRDVELLRRVAEHKSVYFQSSWAKYDLARPGTLRLVPPDHQMDELAADYREMAPMIFDEPPPAFEAIIKRLTVLEGRINGEKP